MSTGEVTKREPASINAAFKCWWVNSGEFEPDDEGSHWGVFWEPLYVDLPESAHPSCCLGQDIVFYDKTGNKLLKDHVRHYGFMGASPHLLNLNGMWREVVGGRVEYRPNLGWYMRWSVVTNSRFAMMLNAAEGLIQS